MRITYNIIGFLVATFVLVSCIRKNDILDPVVLPAGGQGGLATIVVTPQHHKKNINSGKVYIKYAATEMAEISDINQFDRNLYDDSATVSFGLGRPASTFPKLTQGDYYFFCIGTDNTLEQGNDQVFGGAHFRVVDTLEKTYDLYLQLDNHKHHNYRR